MLNRLGAKNLEPHGLRCPTEFCSRCFRTVDDLLLPFLAQGQMSHEPLDFSKV